ncbi:MAG TPA: NAD(P)H-hydrate dehydratase [Longimicrobiales bacterium]|nr:NAD(P)H-hydrate dehydratase [Longimicrobiales bacterium]
MTGWRERRDVFGRADVAVLTAAEAGAADRRAREEAGVPERLLMENAGRSAALVLDRLHPRGRVLGYAGAGHNGGDLLVMLRCLHAWGRECAVIHAASRRPDPALLHGTELDTLDIAADAGAWEVLVDGVLGTGATGAPRGAAAAAVRALNGAGRPVLALDLPSGIDATTGSVPAEAVRAAATVTFGWPKLGLLLHPARAYAGRIVAVEIGFPALPDDGASAQAITPEWVRKRLPVRAADAHKGTSGRVLIVAGQEGMAGAAVIAGGAAVSAGAGLVRIASASANRIIVQSAVPEATYFERETLPDAAADGVTAVVIGPGFGTDAAAGRALARALEITAGVPTLLDADALNLLARDPGRLSGMGAARPLVITPHPRELARLLEVTLDAVLDDVVAAAREACVRFGCTVLLKGQPSLVASAGSRLLVNTAGSSDVAVAGMGDQLSGLAGAMLAGGLGPREAAACALYLGGRAADLAGRGRALSPRDVSAHVARALRDPGARRSRLRFPFITFDQPPAR